MIDTARTHRPHGIGVRVLASLAAREVGRHALHPVFVAGMLLIVVQFLAMGGIEDGSFTYIAATGYAFVPAGVGAFIASHAAASRARRDRAEPWFRSMPTSDRVRATAHLSGACALGLAAAAVVSAWGVVAGFEALIHFADGPRMLAPTTLELAQGPLFVLFCGCLGVFAARGVKTRFIGLVFLIVAIPQLFVVGWSTGDDPIARMLPLVDHKVSVDWIELNPDGSGIDVVGSFRRDVLSWHLLYLVGLTGVVALLALPRVMASRLLRVGFAAAVAISVVGAIGQTVA